MAPVEPVIVEYCVKLSRIGQPLTREEAVALAISLITGTELENTVIAWKKPRRPELESQLRKRELRDAEESESKGLDLSVVNLRVLLDAVRVSGGDNEEALLLKQKEDLAAELVRRRNLRNTTSPSGDDSHY
jgi:hypothetical protein